MENFTIWCIDNYGIHPYYVQENIYIFLCHVYDYLIEGKCN